MLTVKSGTHVEQFPMCIMGNVLLLTASLSCSSVLPTQPTSGCV